MHNKIHLIHNTLVYKIIPSHILLTLLHLKCISEFPLISEGSTCAFQMDEYLMDDL